MSAGSIQLRIFIISFYLLANGQYYANARPVKIVSEHKSAYSILVSENADPVIRFSVSELQRYINLMTGVLIPVTTDASGHPYIAVKKQEHIDEDAESWDDSYSIKYTDLNISITATGSRGVLYGVYEFLEKLGCRWYTPVTEALKPFAETIPDLNELIVEPENIDIKPFMRYRKRDADAGSRSFSPASWPAIIDWAAKQRTNIIAVSLAGFEKNREIIVREAKKRGLTLMVGQHSVMKTFLPREQFFDEHPDWYGLIGEKRTTYANEREVVFETSNEAALKTFTGNLVAYLRDHPEIDIFQLWPPDVAYWSESNESKSLGTPADRMAALVRKIFSEVRNSGLKTRISFLAYSYYTDPPADMSFDKDILLEFCPINQNFNYILSDGKDSANLEYFNQLGKWRKEYPGDIIHYSYYAKYSWRSLPVVLPRQIAQEIRLWHETGETGSSLYCEPGNWLSLEINHLVFSMASANPDFDVKRWYAGYLDSRFGKASEEMKKYFRLATEISLKALIPQSSGNLIDKFFKINDKAAGMMRKARINADKEEAKWIIDKLSWQPEYLYLALQLRKSQINEDVINEKIYMEKINTLIRNHQEEGTILDRGYGYKIIRD